MTELSLVKYIEYDKDRIEQGVHGKMRRVAIDQHGKIQGIHHPNNTNLWEDETEVDWEEYESNGWNCMVQIPQVYYRVEYGTYKELEDVRRWSVSSAPAEDYKLHPAFDRPDGIHNYQYMSAFEGWVDEHQRLRSLPNKEVSRTKTLDEFRTHARMNSAEGWAQQDFMLTSLIQLLFIAEYGTLNSQEILGMGGSNQNTGRSLANGNHSTNKDTSNYVSYRGIENIFSNRNKWIDGVNINNREWFVSGNYKTYETDKYTGDYKSFVTAPSSNGNIRDMHKLQGSKDFGFIPSEINGSYNQDGFCDYYGQSSGKNVLGFGYRSGSADAGLFYWRASFSTSNADANVGARLQFFESLE